MPPHSRRRRGSHAISSVTQAHEQRLEHLRPQDLRPKLTNDRPLCVLGRLFWLRLCRFRSLHEEAHQRGMTCPAALSATMAGMARRVRERQGGEDRDEASAHRSRSTGQRPAGDAGTEAHRTYGEGEQMTEAGMLSIVPCGTTYQVRYASSGRLEALDPVKQIFDGAIEKRQREVKS